MRDILFDNFPHPLRVGFGASGAWGQSWFPQDAAIEIVQTAYEHGVRHFDSAGFYNNGEAERRLGLALRGCDDVFISTKTGTVWRGNSATGIGQAQKDFSADAIQRDLEASLKRLHRSRIDTYYLHGPEDWVVSHTRPVFEDLKREGLIGKAGICGEGDVLAKGISERKTDAIMARYNLFDRGHADIFSVARQADIQTVAIAPLGQAMYRAGFLRPTNRASLWALLRAVVRNPRQLIRQRAGVVQTLNRLDGYTAAQLMMGYVLSQPFVDVALTSTTQLSHLTDTIKIARADGLDRQMLARLGDIAQGLGG